MKRFCLFVFLLSRLCQAENNTILFSIDDMEIHHRFAVQLSSPVYAAEDRIRVLTTARHLAYELAEKGRRTTRIDHLYKWIELSLQNPEQTARGQSEVLEFSVRGCAELMMQFAERFYDALLQQFLELRMPFNWPTGAHIADILQMRKQTVATLQAAQVQAWNEGPIRNLSLNEPNPDVMRKLPCLSYLKKTF